MTNLTRVWKVMLQYTEHLRTSLLTRPARQVDHRQARQHVLATMPEQDLKALMRQYYPHGRLSFRITRQTLIAAILDYEFGPAPNTFVPRTHAERTIPRRKETR